MNDQAVYEPLNVNEDLAIQDDYHENVNPQPYLPYNDFPLPALDADYDFPLQNVEGLIEFDPQYIPYLSPSLSNLEHYQQPPILDQVSHAQQEPQQSSKPATTLTTSSLTCQSCAQSFKLPWQLK